MGNRHKRGFTLVEAIVSVSILGVGVVGVVMGMQQIVRTETQMLERQTLQQLADDKYSQLLAEGDIQAASLNGDFEDRGNSEISWEGEVIPTGITDLETLRVTVFRTANGADAGERAQGLVYIPTSEAATTP